MLYLKYTDSVFDQKINSTGLSIFRTIICPLPLKKFLNVQRIVSLLLVLLSFGACSTETTYLRWVGDIPENPRLDDPEFQPCHGDQFVQQYFHMNQGGLQYEG